jgi:Bacterial Ig domain/Right handed beta helix region
MGLLSRWEVAGLPNSAAGLESFALSWGGATMPTENQRSDRAHPGVPQSLLALMPPLKILAPTLGVALVVWGLLFAYLSSPAWAETIVTINQASGQADPTTDSPIHFTAVFNEPVTGFTDSDVTLSGTAGATTADVTEQAPNDGTTYDVAVNGMTTDGTVIASIPANAAQDADQNGNTASTSTDNTVDFDAPNIAPTAVGDSYTTNEDTPLTANGAGSNPAGVLANDTDPDGDSLNAVLVSGPSHAATNGFTLNQDGSFSYTPAANFFGTDTFTYKANDGSADSNVATVTITVTSADKLVPCGPDGVSQDLAATVNADDPAIDTRFQLEGGCTYTVDTVVALKNGDEIVGPEGSFIERLPAFDPEPTVTIVGSEGLSNVIRAWGTVHLEWVKIVGGTGEYAADGSPVAGTGSGLAMGTASSTSSLYAVHITGSDAAGITNAHGTFERIELDDTTQDPGFLGFNGSGMKAVTEIEVKNSYIHDNQGNGVWCDEECNDTSLGTFHIYKNLVVDNNEEGIRWEKVGDDAAHGEALIEDNEVHGNGRLDYRIGIHARDAQDALIRGNNFGSTTIAGVSYASNSGGAIRASDSGRSDRPDLANIEITGNTLNGETIKGCELPDEIVDCSEQAQPPPPTDTTPPETTIDFGPSGNVKSRDATFTFSSNEPSKATFQTRLDGGDWEAPDAATSKTYSNLANGTHTFEVKATDAAGNTDPTPASRRWKVGAK